MVATVSHLSWVPLDRAEETLVTVARGKGEHDEERKGQRDRDEPDEPEQKLEMANNKPVKNPDQDT